MGIELTSDPNQITIDLTGFDGVFAIKRHLTIPTHLVTSVDAVDRKEVGYVEGTWLRAPGTHIPGLIRYGSYGTAPLREFWAVYRQKRVLVMTVRDWDYARVILGIRDPDNQAAAVSAALA
jgi:hypothetical protein